MCPGEEEEVRAETRGAEEQDEWRPGTGKRDPHAPLQILRETVINPLNTTVINPFTTTVINPSHTTYTE